MAVETVLVIRQLQDSPIGCAVCAKEGERVLRVQKVQRGGAAQKNRSAAEY